MTSVPRRNRLASLRVKLPSPVDSHRVASSVPAFRVTISTRSATMNDE